MHWRLVEPTCLSGFNSAINFVCGVQNSVLWMTSLLSLWNSIILFFSLEVRCDEWKSCHFPPSKRVLCTQNRTLSSRIKHRIFLNLLERKYCIKFTVDTGTYVDFSPAPCNITKRKITLKSVFLRNSKSFWHMIAYCLHVTLRMHLLTHQHPPDLFRNLSL